MRLLVLGAGGTGGYFGGRLAQAGFDVTFLVREARQQQLQQAGLLILSPLGDAHLRVNAITAQELKNLSGKRPFDMVLLSCKAYDLRSSMEAIAPAVEEGADVLPILNGLLHYDALDARFGRELVIGGLCFISATKGEHGEILHLGRPASLTYGERDGGDPRPRLRSFARACTASHLEHVLTPDIPREQWIKFSFLAALAAGTCLMRASIGQIVASEGGAQFMAAMYAECAAVAAAAGQPIPQSSQSSALFTLRQADSALKASMLRDLEAGQAVEAEHIVGDMVRRGKRLGAATPKMAAAWLHLQAYEANRSR
ncbi:2-dehydropantoate 2-reductase [Pseudoxanthomonas indica]|uniref:2-dehydropantoate 2-reductase n=1 Tax=Pseudoxanthomonas indica TaxID=428993 RepID=A0A1T5KLY9_9GAMM|nr:2-dehydropantoate 2-reductase [Pseudoxanthomonas indica]GGD50137.1 2-dehydropantoate 2-reductase [Pseudoxanthomonas indica]SKC64762.1 ketopantoate reductase [Pseudoxanthomonas indica]